MICTKCKINKPILYSKSTRLFTKFGHPRKHKISLCKDCTFNLINLLNDLVQQKQLDNITELYGKEI